MKNFFLSFLILASIYTAYSAIVAPGSSAIGSNPVSGYVLQTSCSGVNCISAWVATSTLGITAFPTINGYVQNSSSTFNLSTTTTNYLQSNLYANLSTTSISHLYSSIGKNPTRSLINESNLVLTVGSGKQFTTIQSAVDTIPVNIAYPVRVNVDCGTYPEDVVVQPSIGTRLVNGSVISVPLQITGSTTNPGCVIVNSFTFNGTAIGSYTGLNGFTIATSSPYSITGDGELAGISAFGVTDLGLNYIRFLSGVDGLLCYESHCMLGEDVDFGNNVLTGNAIKSKRGNARVDFDPANTWNASGTVGQYAYDAQSSGVINFNSNKSSLTGNIGLINVDDNKMGQVFDGGDRAMYMLQKIYPVASTTVGSVLEISNINDPNGLTSLKLTEGLGTPSSWSFNSRNTNPDSGLTLSGGIYGDERFMMSVDLGRNFGFATTSGSGWRLPAHITIQDVTDNRNALSLATYFNDGSPVFRVDNRGQIQSGTTTGDSFLSIVGTSSLHLMNVSSSTGISYFKILDNGNVGIGTSTPFYALDINGTMHISNALFDSTNASGTYGKVLMTSGTSTVWVSTSSLGISGGPGGSLTGTGSNGLLALWDSASSLVTSLFMDNGTVTGVGATSSLVKFNVQGSGTLNPLNIASSTGVSLFSIANTGRVMIGSGTPSSLLTVNQSTTTFQAPLSGTSVHFIGQSDSPFRMSVDTYSGASTFGSQIQFRRALGTSDTPLAVTASSTLFTIASDGYGTTGFHASSITSISGMAEGPFTDTSAPSILRFFTTATGSVTSLERFLIGSNGRLSIGTTSVETVATSSPYLKLDFFARDLAGNTVLSTKIASTTEITLQPAFASRRISMWTSGGSATGYQFGLSQTSSSTGVDTVPTFANGYTSQQRTLFSTVVTTLNQQVGIRSNSNFFRSATTSFGGFYAVADFGFTSWTAGNRFYTGFSTCTSGDCIASTSTIVNRQDIAGFMVDGMTNTLVFATNDNAGVISTTSISGMPTFAANSRFRTYIYSPAGDPNIYWRIDNMISGLKIAEGVATSNLMRQKVNHAYINLCSNGSNTAANACQLGMMRFYIESQ